MFQKRLRKTRFNHVIKGVRRERVQPVGLGIFVCLFVLFCFALFCVGGCVCVGCVGVWVSVWGCGYVCVCVGGCVCVCVCVLFLFLFLLFFLSYFKKMSSAFPLYCLSFFKGRGKLGRGKMSF